MMATTVTLIILTVFAFEMEFILTFLFYLVTAENLWQAREQYCIQKFYKNETECFDNGFPWTTFPTKFSPVVRLRSMPIHPRKIRPKLLRYDKAMDKWVNFVSGKLEKNQSSIIITHGWAPEKSGKEERLHLLYAKEFYHLLSQNESNLLLLAIDWKRGASSLNYPECYNNIRVVARYIYKQLVDINYDFETAHLIGHSLGAHLMGYLAKESLKETGAKVKRITGLDPAGPGFNFPAEWYEEFTNLSETHLWHTDAEFVDVVHTDAGRFGTGNYGLPTQLGHSDFYPAGGKNQPYCQFKNWYRELSRLRELDIDDIIRSSFGMQSTCDHRVAKVYLIHSYLHPEYYCVGNWTSNDKKVLQDNYQGENCLKNGTIMGYFAKKIDDGARHNFFIPAQKLPTEIDKSLNLTSESIR